VVADGALTAQNGGFRPGQMLTFLPQCLFENLIKPANFYFLVRAACKCAVPGSRAPWGHGGGLNHMARRFVFCR
jgi:hypothetical protein